MGVTIMKPTFGDRLRKLRTEKGYSLESFGKRFGLSKDQMHRYEKGKSDPDLSLVISFASFFSVSTDYLLGHEEKKTNELEYYKSKIATEFPDIDLMFHDLESLNAEDMKEVYDYIKFKKSQKK